MSVGVAVASGSAVDFSSMFAAADAALYEAKRAGRDRVVSMVDLPETADRSNGKERRSKAGRVLVGAEAGTAHPNL